MAEQEQIKELGAIIRDEIKRLDMPPPLPGGPRFGATEHDIARAIIDAGWIPEDDEPPGEGARLTSDESSAIYDAYRCGDDAMRLQDVVESIAQRAYASGRIDGRKEQANG
jgi:hypothetical protein